MKLDSIRKRAGKLIIAAALAFAGCGGGTASTDGGGGNAAAGTGGSTGIAGAGGTAGTAGASGRGGTGGASGGGGAGGRGGTGGASGTGGAAGRGGTGGASGASGAGGRGSTGGTGGGTSCTSAAGCSASQYCDFSNNRCTGVFGTCQPRPQGCTLNVDPVCGCDGNVHTNACVAAAAGTDISDLGGCTPPTGTFACGPRFCMHGTQFCEGRTGGAVENPGGYSCVAVPAGCNGTPTCACVQPASTCGNCTMSNSGDLTTACQFP